MLRTRLKVQARMNVSENKLDSICLTGCINTSQYKHRQSFWTNEIRRFSVLTNLTSQSVNSPYITSVNLYIVSTTTLQRWYVAFMLSYQTWNYGQESRRTCDIYQHLIVSLLPWSLCYSTKVIGCYG